MKPVFRPFASTVRTYWIAFIASIVCGLLSQVYAQTPDPLVDEGVQLTIKQQEIAHLQRSGQLNTEQYQLANQAFRQQSCDYNQKVAQLPADQQASIKNQVANRIAIVLPPIRQKWDDEERLLRDQANALSAERFKELENDAQAAAELQTDRTFLQRQLENKTISQQEADSQDAADLAKITALQGKFTSYGGNWGTRFNQRFQQLTDQLVTARELKERLDDTSSEIGKDAHRATELSLGMKKNQMRRAVGVITYSQEDQQDAPLKSEFSSIQAKYATGGTLAASAQDFNERVDELVNKGVRAKTQQWDRDASAEYAANHQSPTPQRVAAAVQDSGSTEIATTRTWVYNNGKTLTGTYVRAGSDVLVLNTPDQRSCVVEISALSANDQAYVAKMRDAQGQALLTAAKQQQVVAQAASNSLPPARDAIAQPSIAPFVNSSDAAAATGYAACGGFFGLIICIIGASIALNIVLLVWVARDARNRGMDSPVIWMVVVLLTSWVGLLIYLFTRPKGNLIPCPSCNNKRLAVGAKCPHCGNA